MKPSSLRIVHAPVQKHPLSDDQRKRRIMAGRKSLLSAAMAYINEGQDGTRNDRIRTASNLSGIPTNMLAAHRE
jgi:uncharacterized protein (DUF39 family)